MKKGMVVLSFDDGRKDLIHNVIPMLEEMNIPATLNITTGFIDGTLREECRFCSNSHISICDLKKINNNLFEIAAHGDQHLNTLSDIIISLNKLREWGVVENKVGFASPCHGLDGVSNEEITGILRKGGLKYIRIGTRLPRTIIGSFVRQMISRMNCKTGFKKIYSSTLNDVETNGNIFTCIPYNKNISNDLLKEMVYSAESVNKIVIFLFHSVLKKNESYYRNKENMDYDKFRDFCSFLCSERKSGRILIKKNIECL